MVTLDALIIFRIQCLACYMVNPTYVEGLTCGGKEGFYESGT